MGDKIIITIIKSYIDKIIKAHCKFSSTATIIIGYIDNKYKVDLSSKSNNCIFISNLHYLKYLTDGDGYVLTDKNLVFFMNIPVKPFAEIINKIKDPSCILQLILDKERNETEIKTTTTELLKLNQYDLKVFKTVNINSNLLKNTYENILLYDDPIENHNIYEKEENKIVYYEKERKVNKNSSAKLYSTNENINFTDTEKYKNIVLIATGKFCDLKKFICDKNAPIKFTVNESNLLLESKSTNGSITEEFLIIFKNIDNGEEFLVDYENLAKIKNLDTNFSLEYYDSPKQIFSNIKIKIIIQDNKYSGFIISPTDTDDEKYYKLINDFFVFIPFK